MTQTDPRLKPLATTDDEWRERLDPQEFHVLRQAGTERPFTGFYVNVDTEGLYRCRACGNPLFDSETKYHSHCGWPSFTNTVTPDAVELLEDTSHGMYRVEARCNRCHSHLGHLFPDGPQESGGQRWCINSLSIELDEENKVPGAISAE